MIQMPKNAALAFFTLILAGSSAFADQMDYAKQSCEHLNNFGKVAHSWVAKHKPELAELDIPSCDPDTFALNCGSTEPLASQIAEFAKKIDQFCEIFQEMTAGQMNP